MSTPSDEETPPAAEEAGIARQLTLGLQSVLYDARFMDAHVGRTLLSDPIAALVELVANAWDAGATRVRIAWPTQDNGTIAVQDNGTGMTDEEFQRRWRTMNGLRAEWHRAMGRLLLRCLVYRGHHIDGPTQSLSGRERDVRAVRDHSAIG